MARKNDILSIYAKEVEEIREAGLFKGEAPIASAQGARVKLEDGREVINMCANNYLGLGDSQRLIDAAKRTYTNSWRNGYPISLEPMTPSSILPVLMPTEACLRQSWARKML